MAGLAVSSVLSEAGITNIVLKETIGKVVDDYVQDGSDKVKELVLDRLGIPQEEEAKTDKKKFTYRNLSDLLKKASKGLFELAKVVATAVVVEIVVLALEADLPL